MCQSDSLSLYILYQSVVKKVTKDPNDQYTLYRRGDKHMARGPKPAHLGFQYGPLDEFWILV